MPLQGHHARTARAVVGLEGVVVDFDRMLLTALESTDERSLEIRVAGTGALLVAKLHKISERLGSARLNDKDALDVLRLLRGTPLEELAARIERLRADQRSRDVAEAAVGLLPEWFGSRASEGARMAVRATQDLSEAAEIALSCELLANDLLRLLKR